MANILPYMARLGRDSLLTRKLSIILQSKLDKAELDELQKWLQIVESDQQLKINKAKRMQR